MVTPTTTPWTKARWPWIVATVVLVPHRGQPVRQ